MYTGHVHFRYMNESSNIVSLWR